MKCITLLLDGASDRSYDILNHLTPLQYANTPHLDKVAKDSQCGLLTVYKEGAVLGTDLAHLLLFGYKMSDYPSRSIIDVIGENLPLDDETLYLRCSFAEVHKTSHYQLKERFVPNLLDEETKSFIDDLKFSYNGYSFEVVHSYDSHGFVLIRGKNLTPDISDSDPFRKDQLVMKVEPFETDSKEAFELSDAVNAFILNSYQVLSVHNVNKSRLDNNLSPVNMVLTKWAGMKKSVLSFEEQNGMRGVLVGKSKLLKGLADYVGMDYYQYTSFDEAVEYALSCDYDYVHLHTKEPDEASHKKSPELKVEVLERLDDQIKPLLDFSGLLIVTSDHSTPCRGDNIHSGESVAFMARGEFIRRDDVSLFNEISCAKGSIHLSGDRLMHYINGARDKGVMYHLRQGSRRKSYIINKVNPL